MAQVDGKPQINNGIVGTPRLASITKTECDLCLWTPSVASLQQFFSPCGAGLNEPSTARARLFLKYALQLT